MTTTEPISCPFTVLIDTSEQHPWTYRGLSDDAEDFITEEPSPWTFEGMLANADKKYAPLVVNCRPANLMTGDYTIAGFENHIVIERKSLSDAWSTFTHDRERWERELDRMRSIPFCDVVIEGSEQDFRAGPVKSGGANVGKACWRSVMSWRLDYPNVHWWLLGDRQTAEATAFRLLEKFWEKDQWQFKQLQKLSIESSTSSSRKKSRSSQAKGLFPVK